jgi:acetylglutamate kinase
MISKGTISGGMIPKMKCCIDAVEMGVKSVCLISGKKAHALLELFSGKAVGTIIEGGNNNVEGKYIENICAV